MTDRVSFTMDDDDDLTYFDVVTRILFHIPNRIAAMVAVCAWLFIVKTVLMTALAAWLIYTYWHVSWGDAFWLGLILGLIVRLAVIMFKAGLNGD